MFDIDAKYNQILVKHGVIKNITLESAIHTLNLLEQKFQQGKRIGLYGCGIEAEGLMSFISNYTDDLKLEYCFDKKIRVYQYKNKILNKNVLPVEKIKEVNIDCVVLGSYKFRDEFKKNLCNIGYKGDIFDLYEYLEEYIQEHFSDYEIIYNLRQEYQKETQENKEVLLQQLIKNYLLIKDFLSAFDLVDIYCKHQYSGFENYLELKRELSDLLRDIHNCVNSRGNRDIIINWVDSISCYDLENFPFLNKRAKEGINFTNAFTVTPWTTETKKTILYGEYPIEGKLFLREELKKEDMKLIQLLDKNGYKFGYCGAPRYAKIFDVSIMTPLTYYENKYTSSLQKQWDALSMICMNEKPICILIQTLYETHAPYICGEGDTLISFKPSLKDWEKEICRVQADISGRYIDKALEFYEHFYGDHAVKVYMSDHGRGSHSPMDEHKVHTVLFINGVKFKKEEVEGIFSLVNFPDLMQAIIDEKEDWKELTSDYAIIENLDAYNMVIVNMALSGEYLKEEMYQCRGIVTKKDKYFLYASGKEYYFSSLTSKKNEIDNSEYAERIEELRKLCGKEFIDIYQYEKFKYSRLLYENDKRQEELC